MGEMNSLAEETKPATGDRILAWMVAALAFAVPLVALVTPLGMAPLGIIAVVVGIAATWRTQSWRDLPRVPVALLTLIGLYGVTSALWTIDPTQSIKTSVRILAMALGGIWLVAAVAGSTALKSRIILGSLAAGLLLSGVLLLWEYTADHAFSHMLAELKGGTVIGLKSPLNRGATAFSLLLWPLALMVARRFGRRPAMALVLFGVTVVFLGDSNSGKLSCALAVTLFLIGWRLPRLTFAMVRGGFVALVMALPVIAAHMPSPQETFVNWQWLPLSAHHRLTIWSFAGDRIAERPVLGWGMDGARSIPGGDDEIVVKRPHNAATGQPFFAMSESMMPLHPHNAILQWWLELGLAGVVFLTAFFWWLIGRVEGLSLSAAEKATFLAIFGAGMVVSTTSYGFWQSWWQATLWLTALLWTAGISHKATRS